MRQEVDRRSMEETYEGKSTAREMFVEGIIYMLFE